MKMSILSINGNKPFNYILQTVLSKDHYVTVASDPITGLKQMKSSGNISLVIIDTDSFEEEAVEFIEYLKSSLLFQVPIIILTTNETAFIQQKLSQLNVNDSFVKPFNPLDLVKRVNHILNVNLLNSNKA